MILYLAFLAFMNRLRGGRFDHHGLRGARWVASAGVGIASYAVSLNEYIAAICALGFFLWALPAWGLYFASVTGTWDQSRKDVGFIDRIGYRVFPFIDGGVHPSNYKRGILCMGIRGGVFSFPLFAGLAFFNPIALALWPVMFLQGFAYWAYRGLTGINPIGYAEYAWGFVMAALLYQIVNV